MTSTGTMALEGLSPRVRGNRHLHARPAGPLRGLSPRVRGNRTGVAIGYAQVRVYPRVCGGTPLTSTGTTWNWRVYPRVCGGTATQPDPLDPFKEVYPRVCGGTRTAIRAGEGYVCGGTRNKGLSPRVRGNLYPVPCCVPTLRSIPACAGEPVIIRPVIICDWVYPRVCGGTS